MAKKHTISINGYALRKVKVGPGMEHEAVYGELTHNGRRMASFADEGFGGGMHFTSVADGHLNAVRRLFSTSGAGGSFIDHGDFALELLVSILLNGAHMLRATPEADRVALVLLERDLGNGVCIRDLTLVPLEGDLGERVLAQTLPEFRELRDVKPLDGLNFIV